MLDGESRATASSPAKVKGGIFAGHGKPPGGLAVLFPGQGSQYVGMLREAACLFPAMQAALAEFDRLDGDRADGGRLVDRLYPLAAFGEPERDANEAALRATEVAQPAIGAVSLGLYRLLQQFGVKVDALAGHSFGELTALCAAGRLDDASFARLSRERGRLMAEQAARGGGAMLAVMAPLGVVEEVLSAEGLDASLVVANKNGPRQFVLSGPSDAIERASRAFTARKVTTRALAVSAAFHSPDVAAASGPFLEALQASPLAPGAVPVFANSTAQVYPADPADARALLAGQLARPVEFAAMIEAMADSGIGTFLEVGPDSKLTGLVRSILDAPGRPARALALDASRGASGNLHDLASALAELAALGYPVDLTPWDPDAAPTAPTRKPGLTVKLSGANVAPKPSRSAPTPKAPAVAASPAPARPTPVPPTVTSSATAPPRAQAKAPTSTPPPVASSMTTPPPTPASSPRPAPPAASNGTGHAEHSRNGHPSSPAASPSNGSTTPAIAFPSLAESGASPSAMHEALRAAQENLVALQRLSAQTADLHRLFLEGQDRTQRTFQSLLDQQQRLTLTTLGRPAAHETPAPATAVIRASNPPVAIAPAPPTAPIELPPALPEAPARAARPVVAPAPATTAAPARQHDQPVVAASNARPAPQAVPAPSRTAPNAAADVTRALLEVVAEKTGYPVEMLEPAMLLDADLGIDSIKRVEILSAIQERLPDAPAVKPEHLGTLRSLQDIIDFLADSAETSVTVVTPAPNAAAPTVDVAAVQTVLLGVVAEKTGYPVEMLEPAMLLDADLGIDSIKRVEILSAIQERLPDAPAVKPEHLGTLRSLQDIIDFLAESAAAPTGTGAAPQSVQVAAAVEEPAAALPVQRLVVRAKAAPDHSGAEPHYQAIRPEGTVWVLDDGAGLAPGIVTALQHRGLGARLIGTGALGQLVVPTRLDGLVLVAPPGGEGDRHLKDAFRLLRTAGPALRAAGAQGGALVVTVSRLDGSFGTHDLPADAEPASGGLAGLAKTAGHEWPEVGCRAIDLDPALGQGPEAAEAVVAEIFRPGPVEVGLSHSGRSILALEPAPFDDEAPTRHKIAPLGPGDVVVITGGARGVTAEVAVALAEAFQPTLVLFGRSPAPDAEPDWLAGLAGEPEIKRALAHRANGQATPQVIGEQYRRVAANREILRNLERIAAAGATAVYRQVDVRDPSAVTQALDEVRAAWVRSVAWYMGRACWPTAASRTRPTSSSPRSTTPRCWGFALLDTLGPDELRLLVLFSSTTARFGRTGQVAYAAANEVLNKFAQREARRRTGCRVVSVNWGPWDGGMVTPSLRGVFASEGVGLIPLEAGARYLVAELCSNGERPVEVVVLGGNELPVAVAPRATGFMAAAEPTSDTPSTASQPVLTAVFERPLSLTSLPILRSHVIDGRGVVPMALTLEWLAQGALQRNPGLCLAGVDDLRLFKGVVLNEDRPETLSVLVGKARRDGDLFRVPVELRGLIEGDRVVAHARAEVVLSSRPSVATSTDRLAFQPQPAYGRSMRSVYHDVLFHGPDLHAIEAIDQLGPSGFSAVVRTGAAPETWVERPLRQAWLSDPLGIDCAFQLMTLWAAEQAGAPSLPTRVGRYRQFVRAFPTDRVRVQARIERPAEHRAEAEIEIVDLSGNPVARIHGYECVIDLSLTQAFRRNRILVGKAVPAPR
ncbi:MAG: polyketide synthase dehydratase domain-containing protein [Isosphaeraceae bacterium]